MTKNPEDMKQINIKITQKQYKKLDELSQAYGGISKSNLIRIAISEYTHNHQHLTKKE